jgi:methyl-accepting chemotaxis protein
MHGEDNDSGSFAMNFATLRVSTRIQLLIGLMLLGLVAVSATSLFHLKDSLLQDRKEKTRNLVESAHSLALHYRSLQKNGALDEAAAKAAAVSAVRAMRYEGKEYFWINDTGTPIPKMVMHATVPALDGKLLDAERFNCATSLQPGIDGPVETTDGHRNLFAAFVDVSNRAGRGFVTYNWPKPKEGGGATTELYPKLSYVMKLDDWGWVIGSGIYIDDVDSLFRRQAALLGGLSLAAIAFLSFVGLRLGASILRQLGGEPAVAAIIMQRVAEGDLTTSVENPPPGSMLASLATMVSTLRSLIGEIHSSGRLLVQHAEKIRDAAAQVADAAQSQSDATTSMAASIEELSVSSDHISSTARDTEEDSRNARSQAAEGSRRVGEATEAINNVVGTVRDAALRIHALEDRAVQISSIANVIKEIAGQTNLLALNAAIEAARAGEQGRGFAVVADEVRKLAERTAAATTEIEQMIGGIQSDTAASVVAMNGVLPRVEEGVQLASTATLSLGAIETGAGRTLERIAEVANATREQSAASTSIAQGVEQISRMVEQTNATIQATATSAQELNLIAQGLNAQIARFRV